MTVALPVLVLAVVLAVTGWSWRPVDVVVLAWWAGLVAARPRGRAAWLGAAAVAAVAAVTSAPRIHLHANKAFSTLQAARRLAQPDVRYGDGWSGWVGMPVHLLGDPVDGVHLVHVGAVVLTGGLLADLGARLHGPRAGWLAAALWGSLPVVVALGSTESRFVVVSLLQVAAVAGLARQDGRGDLLAVASIGLLGHVRPLQVPVAALLVVGAWSVGRRRAALAGAVLVAWRAVALGAWLAGGGDRGGTQLEALGRSHVWGGAAGVDGTAVILDPTRTPVTVALLGLAGVALAWRAGRLGRLTLALGVAGVVLYLPQPFVPDRLRMQLPAQAWLALLAAPVLARAAGEGLPRGLAVLAVVALGWLPTRVYPPWAWQASYAVARRVTARLPPDAVVRYTATWDDGNGAFGTWAARRSGARWVPREADPPTGALVWVDVVDHVHGPPDLRGLDPVDVAPVPADVAGLHPLASEVVVGLYRVRGGATP
ncbi:MAG: hypothetical protein H6732_09605 [Alphaproteobacteria bacterium]|nr:hypothetical protein [Alphaproteobacteria bacterium]